MSSIYEDIKALKQRFMNEFNIEADIDIYVHGTNNRARNLGKTAVDIVSRGGFADFDCYVDENNGTRWVKIKNTGYVKDVELTLFYPPQEGV